MRSLSLPRLGAAALPMANTSCAAAAQRGAPTHRSRGLFLKQRNTRPFSVSLHGCQSSWALESMPSRLLKLGNTAALVCPLGMANRWREVESRSSNSLLPDHACRKATPPWRHRTRKLLPPPLVSPQSSCWANAPARRPSEPSLRPPRRTSSNAQRALSARGGTLHRRGGSQSGKATSCGQTAARSSAPCRARSSRWSLRTPL
mmetsp:Transcript_81084/g.262608  ORF Transcript_81084/g.262608 Transcript_81084/m.262608 type:complete len:203 (+) Transcript_81084:274-882(+)